LIEALADAFGNCPAERVLILEHSLWNEPRMADRDCSDGMKLWLVG
jgi:hypothetical protein